MPAQRVRERAVVLLSGGLDSATCLAVAASQGFECHALSFDYSQRHSVELEAARNVARQLAAASHRVIRIDLRAIGGSALTDEIPVPKGANWKSGGIPITYVPARNTMFLSVALGVAEVLGTGHIFIGVNALDYSGYPDCRPEFIEAFERMANVALKATVEGKVLVRIHAPLLSLTKAQIISQGLSLGVDYGLTHSCYDPDDQGRSCGVCDSCSLRLAGFAEIGSVDPVPYGSSRKPERLETSPQWNGDQDVSRPIGSPPSSPSLPRSV